MPTRRKIFAASTIIVFLLTIKWTAPFIPVIIKQAGDLSIKILLILFLLLIVFGLFKLVQILVRE